MEINLSEMMESIARRNGEEGERWRKLREKNVPIVELFAMHAPSTVALYEPDEDEEEAFLFMEELKRAGMAVDFFLLRENRPIRGVIGEHFSDIPIVSMENLPKEAGVDFIVVPRKDHFYETRRAIEEKTAAEVVWLWGMVNFTIYKHSNFALYAGQCTAHDVKMCVLEWPYVQDFEDPELYERAYKGDGLANGFFAGNPDYFGKLYDDVAEYSDEYIKEIFEERPITFRDGDYSPADCRGKFVNIVNGCRYTCEQPEQYDAVVPLWGGCLAYGIGTDDRYTIASFLQREINEYCTEREIRPLKVVNHGSIGVETIDIGKMLSSYSHVRKKYLIYVMRGDLGYPKGRGGKFHAYIKRSLEEIGFEYIDLTSTLEEVERSEGAYFDVGHVNHRGYRAVAKKAFEGFVRPILDREEPAHTSVRLTAAQKLAAIDAGAALRDFFKRGGIRTVSLFVSKSERARAAEFAGIAQTDDVKIEYVIGAEAETSGIADGAERIDLSELSDVHRTDITVAFVGRSEFPNIKNMIKKRTRASVLVCDDLVDILYDRQYRYAEIARALSSKRVSASLVFWPEADDVDAWRDGYPDADWLQLEDVNAKYGFLKAALYSEIPEASQGYVNEVFLCDKGILKPGQGKKSSFVGKYVRVANGGRFTPGLPDDCDRTIFVFGGSEAFGIGTDDANTIPAVLQALANKHDASAGKCRVVNRGVPCRGVTPDEVWAETVLPAITAGEIRDGDIVLWFVPRRYDITEKDKKIYAALTSSLLDLGIRIVDLAETMRRAQNTRPVYVDPHHVNHRGYHAAASKVYYDFLKNVLDGEDDVTVKRPQESAISEETGKESVTDDLDREFEEYLQYLAEHKFEGEGSIGAIVMNCNPFSNGHRFLVERAASQVDFLYVFVVEEDQSFFKFADRYRLVSEGLRDLENVRVLESGKFIISTVTFPDYFSKDSAKEIAVDTSLDLRLFAQYIAPALGIGVRFVGNEPLCPVTRQYNNAMRETLPRHGVEFVEFERIEQGGAPISASRIRALLQEKRFEEIRPLVPDVTYRYLEESYR